jgi:hypothetical protein
LIDKPLGKAAIVSTVTVELALTNRMSSAKPMAVEVVVAALTMDMVHLVAIETTGLSLPTNGELQMELGANKNSRTTQVILTTIVRIFKTQEVVVVQEAVETMVNPFAIVAKSLAISPENALPWVELVDPVAVAP